MSSHRNDIPRLGWMVACIVILVATLPTSAWGQECPDNPAWSPAENWVWQQSCHDSDANFDARLGQKVPDPRNQQGWNADRKLSGSFLRELMVAPLYRTALKRLVITGAWVDGDADLSGLELPLRIEFHDTRFTGRVDFSSSVTRQSIVILASFLGHGADFSDSRIGDQLWMTGTTVDGELDLQFATIRNTVLIDKAHFKSISAGRLSTQQLALVDTTVDDKFDGDGMHARGLILLDQGNFGSVNLRGATAGDELTLSGTKISGDLILQWAKVHGLLFGEGRFGNSRRGEFGSVNAEGLTVTGRIVLGGADFK